MGFNELNSVEHYIIHQLSGVNLNMDTTDDSLEPYQWIYRKSEQINRGVKEVLFESEVREALIRLNPKISQNPELADELEGKIKLAIENQD